MQDYTGEFREWLDSDEGKEVIGQFREMFQEGLEEEYWTAFRDGLLLPVLFAAYKAGVDTDLLASAYQSGYMDGSTILDNPNKVN